MLRFQQPIGGSGEGSLSNWEYDEMAIRKALTYFIILDEQPFKLVEGVRFRYLMSLHVLDFISHPVRQSKEIVTNFKLMRRKI